MDALPFIRLFLFFRLFSRSDCENTEEMNGCRRSGYLLLSSVSLYALVKENTVRRGNKRRAKRNRERDDDVKQASKMDRETKVKNTLMIKDMRRTLAAHIMGSVITD